MRPCFSDFNQNSQQCKRKGVSLHLHRWAASLKEHFLYNIGVGLGSQMKVSKCGCWYLSWIWKLSLLRMDKKSY